MRFFLLLVTCFILIVFSSEISAFLSAFFLHPLHNVLAIFTGIFAFVALNVQPKTVLKKLVGKVSFFVFLLGIILFFIFWMTAYFLEKVDRNELWNFFIFSGSGFFAAIAVDRLLIPKIEKLIRISTQKSGTERDKKSDIREIENSFRQKLTYDPLKFFFQKDGFLV